EKGAKTYNTRDSLVVTDTTTSRALTGLSMGERTGSRIFQWVWSYVVGFIVRDVDMLVGRKEGRCIHVVKTKKAQCFAPVLSLQEGALILLQRR
ncbi:hypothetical protein B0T14DRAFT_427568, partial [Immersiella caudata]